MKAIKKNQFSSTGLRSEFSRRERLMYRRSLNPKFRLRKTRRVTVRLSESEFRRLEALARKRGVKRSTLIRYYIREGMKGE